MQIVAPAPYPTPVYTASAAAPTPMAAPISPKVTNYPASKATSPAMAYTSTDPNMRPSRTPQEATSPDQFSIGIEGYYDHYKEDLSSLVNEGGFSSLTLGYTHYLDDRWFNEVGLRASRGRVDFESNSGAIDDIPQWEFESRWLAGYDFHAGSGLPLKIYLGLSTRYFRDEAKGKVSSLNESGYDRRTFQLFAPIGARYRLQSGTVMFEPTMEFAPLIWGNVSSRLGTFDTFYNIENRQNKGYHLRSEFAIGQLDNAGRGWQLVPFIRYNYSPDSKIAFDPLDDSLIEPENTRLQAGAGLKFLF
jgi:hypothetical protein